MLVKIKLGSNFVSSFVFQVGFVNGKEKYSLLDYLLLFRVGRGSYLTILFSFYGIV